MLYMYQIFIYDLQRQKKHTNKEAVHPDISGCIVFLFCLVIGGVERGESTGSRTDNRSI